MNSFARLREESNKIGIEFLLTELDSAFTFLNVAGTTALTETRERNRQRAMEAYEVVIRMQSKVVMDLAQKTEFQRQLLEIRKKLAELGFNVS